MSPPHPLSWVPSSHHSWGFVLFCFLSLCQGNAHTNKTVLLSSVTSEQLGTESHFVSLRGSWTQKCWVKWQSLFAVPVFISQWFRILTDFLLWWLLTAQMILLTFLERIAVFLLNSYQKRRSTCCRANPHLTASCKTERISKQKHLLLIAKHPSRKEHQLKDLTYLSKNNDFICLRHPLALGGGDLEA